MAGWCDGAGKLPVPGRSTNLDDSGARAIALAVGGVIWTFFLSSIVFLFFLLLSGRRPEID